MKTLSKEQIKGLGVALNEATLLGVELDVSRSLCGITLSVFSLPEEGPAPTDSRLQILLHPIGRLCASLRHHRVNSPAELPEIFSPSELLAKVRSFGGQPIYGWEFIDIDDASFARWSGMLSLDWQGSSDGNVHTFTLFQEGHTPERTLDLKIWFGGISLFKPTGEKVEIEDVVSGGKRWWDGLHSGDVRTAGTGIFSGKGPP